MGMCNEAAFVVVKEAVFWSRRSDSHETIIEERGLYADGARGPNIARVELSPAHGHFFTDPATWDLKVDQDVTPEWWDPEKFRPRLDAAAREWQAAKVVLPGQSRTVDEGDVITDCYGTVRVLGGSVWRVHDGGVVLAIRNGVVEAVYERGEVRYLTGGEVTLVGRGGKVEMVDPDGLVRRVAGGVVERVSGGQVREIQCGGTVERADSAAIIGSVFTGTVKRVYDGSVVHKVCAGGIVERVEDAVVERVSGGTVGLVAAGGVVRAVYQGGAVKHVVDGGVVQTYVPLPLSVLRGPTAVLIDRSGGTVRCHVGESAGSRLA